MSWKADECCRERRPSGLALLAAAAVLTLLGVWSDAHPAPVADAPAGLPPGSELDDDAIDSPREAFHSEAVHGRKPYLSRLGNLAFNSPYMLGEVARKAHVSCATCHVNGASNPRLFIPGLSARPGTFDTTSALFNPKTDNGVLDAVTIPSLRGARFLAPYGHDGRSNSLRDFVRNVIVNEFAGAPPSQQILDAIVIYIEDIDFLPNPNLDAGGRLKPGVSAAQLRGEALFARAFPNQPQLSCATCHIPSAAFVDHRQHDVGSGGLYKTPTLINADFNGPYFHDGRFDNYGQVVDYFDREYALGLTPAERSNLLAYLSAIGDGTRPEYHLTGTNVLADLNDLASVLDIAIAQPDDEVITLVVATLRDQLQDLAERYPDPVASETTAGARELALARAAVSTLRETLQRLGRDAASGRFTAAAADYLTYRKLTAAAAPLALQSAEPWSLFDPALHAAHAATRTAALPSAAQSR